MGQAGNGSPSAAVEVLTPHRMTYKQAAPRHARTPSTRAAIPTPQRPPYGRVLAMIIRMRLRAGAAIPGRLGTHPLCPPIAVYGGSVRRPQPGHGGVRDLHPPLRRPKALLRAESRSRVTYDHPRSPGNREFVVSVRE